jgi:hypothetical protein
LKAVETVIVDVPKISQTAGYTSIPLGNFRQTLNKMGCIKMLQFYKSDTETILRERIHTLFKEILSSPNHFQFLSAKYRSLVLATPQSVGHSTWTGEAVVLLVGQGSLYLKPKKSDSEYLEVKS